LIYRNREVPVASFGKKKHPLITKCTVSGLINNSRLLCFLHRFPPLQTPETYNLDGILKQMEANKGDD
jgi:hypothetical protein